MSIDVYMKGQLNFLLIWEYKRFWGFNICLSRGCSDRKIFLDVSNSGSILVKIYVFLRLSLAKTMSRSNLANTVVTSCFLCSHFFVETVFEVYIWYDRWIIVFWFFFLLNNYVLWLFFTSHFFLKILQYGFWYLFTLYKLISYATIKTMETQIVLLYKSTTFVTSNQPILNIIWKHCPINKNNKLCHYSQQNPISWAINLCLVSFNLQSISKTQSPKISYIATKISLNLKYVMSIDWFGLNSWLNIKTQYPNIKNNDFDYICWVRF